MLNFCRDSAYARYNSNKRPLLDDFDGVWRSRLNLDGYTGNGQTTAIKTSVDFTPLLGYNLRGGKISLRQE